MVVYPMHSRAEGAHAMEGNDQTAPKAPLRAVRRTCANGALLCAEGAPPTGDAGGAVAPRSHNYSRGTK